MKNLKLEKLKITQLSSMKIIRGGNYTNEDNSYDTDGIRPPTYPTKPIGVFDEATGN